MLPSYRGARWDGLEVVRHTLVLVHGVAELLQGAVGIRGLHHRHVLVVGFVGLPVGFEHLDVVLDLGSGWIGRRG